MLTHWSKYKNNPEIQLEQEMFELQFKHGAIQFSHIVKLFESTKL